MNDRSFKTRVLTCMAAVLFSGLVTTSANSPGGGTGKGPDVTVRDNGDGTVTVANGIVSIVVVKRTGALDSAVYVHSNSGTPVTTETLKGKGQYRIGGLGLGNQSYEYSLATNPASNGGGYADVMLTSATDNQGVAVFHYSMLRGSPGFYTTGIQIHRKQDAAGSVGAWGCLTRVPLNFQWVTVDPRRNFSLGEMGSQKGVRVPDSAHEVLVLLDGREQGEFDDKFIYAQDNADALAWGWSSVGKGGLNVGVWLTTRIEFNDGGPLKRDVATSHDHGLNQPLLTGEVGMGSDGALGEGELWTKTCGPFFYYVNSVPSAITDPAEAARLLYQDAVVQAKAEREAWPYPWFKDENYVPASGRGTVTGRFVINDRGNPDASAAGLWVGLEQQPITVSGTYDFQKWLKPYQYWVQTDAAGNFTIPHVIAGENYTLWAYGPGAAGTFLSQNQTGGNPPLEVNVPAKPFGVSVKGEKTTDLGAVAWTPVRVGSTVFELGYPSRKSDKFRHGEDFWSPSRSPKLGYPTPVWGGQVYYPSDFPNGLTYTVGLSRWSTDWNYVLPSAPDPVGNYQSCTGTINFNLAQAPAVGSTAAIYLACAGDEGGHIVLGVNGKSLDEASGVTAAPNPLNGNTARPYGSGTGGFNPPYVDDSSQHYSDHGPFSDERVSFPGNLLHVGKNTLTITMNAKSGIAYLMVDYLRPELTGYVPAAPASVTACPGNNRVLVRWPVVPGATGYNVLRAAAGGAYAPVATGLVGPVSGSDVALANYTDQTAANGTPYSYVVQSVNPTGRSAASSPSPGVAPAAMAPANALGAPTGLKVASSGHHQVTLNWSASPGANDYRIVRATLHENGVGGFYPLRSIVLNDAVAGTSYVDNTPTDGTRYSYSVEAASAAGLSGPSTAVMAVPLPAPPGSAPLSLTGTWTKSRQGPGITLAWSPVPGAVGYTIYRSTRPDGQFRWPEDFVTTLVETTYTDRNNPKRANQKEDDHLKLGVDYYYQVTAVNAAGVSPSVSVHVDKQVN